jgi:hypothetical protein
MAKKTDDGRKGLTYRVSLENWKVIRRACEEENCSMQELFDRSLDMYLRKKKLGELSQGDVE